jgi:hypothetical protein
MSPFMGSGPLGRARFLGRRRKRKQPVAQPPLASTPVQLTNNQPAKDKTKKIDTP